MRMQMHAECHRNGLAEHIPVEAGCNKKADDGCSSMHIITESAWLGNSYGSWLLWESR